MPDVLAALAQSLGDVYRIERELGRGGMATVYLARDLKHDRAVALKVLDPELSSSIGALRFLREIRLVAGLQHPHILPVFDSGRAGELLWFSMPYVEGESLRQALDRRRQLGIADAVRIACEVADALDYAHRHGIVHRDVKPANILLTESGHALVADFGIARPAHPDDGEALTHTGLTLGTPAYMSPEQAVGDAVDEATDVYSLGCVLFEMLAGEPPFAGRTAQAILARRLAGPAPSLRTVRDRVSPSLEAAVHTALARTPGDRWPSARAFADALRAAGREGGGSDADGPGFAASAHASRSRRALSVGAVVLLLLGAAAAWTFQRDRLRSLAPGATHAARPTDSAVHSLYLRGQQQLAKRTQSGLLQALELFGAATRRDSTFALGWIGMAQALGWARAWEFSVPGIPPESLLVRELEASERAVALDSLIPESWLARARVAGAVDPTTRTASLAAIRRALSIDSLHAGAWQQLGVALEELGDREGALHALHRSRTLRRDGGGLAFLSNHYYWWRQYDSAAAWGDSAVARGPTIPYAHEVAGAAALSRGRLQEAQAHYEAARRLDVGPTAVRALEGLAEVAAARGDTAAALARIDTALALTDARRPSAHAAISLASAYAAVGDTQRALAWLERFQHRGDLHFRLHLLRDPALDPLRSQPRFRAIVDGRR